LSQALKWADVAMALRVQLERHEKIISLDDYRKEFFL
jgi:aspartate carbamoyltransferase catalytic subunit